MENIYQTFCDNTKNTFYLNAVAIILLLVLAFTQSSINIFINFALRLSILFLFMYSIYITFASSKLLLGVGNIFTNSNLAIVRNSFLLNNVFCLILVIFILWFLFYY